MPMRRELYPDDWEEISQRIRFERAKGRCEFDGCDAEHGKPHPVTGSIVVLTVAHLNHDKRDNRDENLRAGCQRCHLGHDRHLHSLNARKTRNKKTGQGELIPETLDRNWKGNRHVINKD